jgi:hypothetical protein
MKGAMSVVDRRRGYPPSLLSFSRSAGDLAKQARKELGWIGQIGQIWGMSATERTTT